MQKLFRKFFNSRAARAPGHKKKHDAGSGLMIDFYQGNII